MTQVFEDELTHVGRAVADVEEEIRPPDIGDYIRDLRQFLGLGREVVRDLCKVSSSYLADVERNLKRPGDQVLESLASAFAKVAAELRAADPSRTDIPVIGEAEKQYMFDLRNPSATFPNWEFLRSQITPAHLEWLHEPYLVAFFDRRWNYLVGNERYQRTFPGLAESGNVMRWYFDLGPATTTVPTVDPGQGELAPWFRFPPQADDAVPVSAKDVLPHWEAEARANTAWFKGLVGTCRTAPWALRMLDELSSNSDFRRFWREEKMVVFGRDRPYMQVRDPWTGEQSVINVLVGPSGPYICTYIGMSVPPNRPVR